MSDKQIRIGASGWSYPEWKGFFYPSGLKSTEWLSYYSKIFDGVEINSSFYHLPKTQTVINWTSYVPEDFFFCPKISRYLTHIKRLKDAEEPLERFFEVFQPMRNKLGPILIQLPSNVSFDYQTVREFFTILVLKYKDYEFALEARHQSWLSKEAIDLISNYDIAWVISQSGIGFPYLEKITAKNIYIRFHGPGKLYDSSYSLEEMQAFAYKFMLWSEEGHTIWAFFNNTMNGHAIANIQQLKEMLGLEINK
jgi:uncharacterized protein YecE (DUF72 family)